ncbi:MAG TPA: hypothetical protein DDZ76_05905, partial [Xanthomonadales bacterium]|nr:hypothetical protein [Xanthomonadales bacterium]
GEVELEPFDVNDPAALAGLEHADRAESEPASDPLIPVTESDGIYSPDELAELDALFAAEADPDGHAAAVSVDAERA